MAKRVQLSERPRSGRVSLGVMFIFPRVKSFATRYIARRQAEIERAQSAQALLQKCKEFANFSGFSRKSWEKIEIK
jgi:hypothetical protein